MAASRPLGSMARTLGKAARAANAQEAVGHFMVSCNEILLCECLEATRINLAQQIQERAAYGQAGP